MDKPYVEQIDGVYRVAGTRVSLDSLVHGFWNGQTAESLAQAFPALTLEEVYGGLAFYLAHRDEVDAYLEQAETELETLRQAARERDPMFHQRLAEARHRAA